MTLTLRICNMSGMLATRIAIVVVAVALCVGLPLTALNTSMPTARGLEDDRTASQTWLGKTALAGVSPALTALFAILLGNRIAAYWGTRQKRREMAITTANEFYRLYGEFFAVWKLWNYTSNTAHDRAEGTQWELLARAAAAEAGIEAILVKVSAERKLTLNEQATLARFRQGYQTLRESIADGASLPWASSDHVAYAAFKRLASRIGSIVTAEPTTPPAADVAERAFLEITSNKWEDDWTRER